MKIIFTDKEYRYVEALGRKIGIPIEKLGATEDDPSIHVKEAVVVDYINQAYSAINTSIHAKIAKNKAMSILSQLPLGALKK